MPRQLESFLYSTLSVVGGIGIDIYYEGKEGKAFGILGLICKG